MIQKLDMYSDFDERVERFLKNHMTAEEEKLFKSELNDPDKKARAQTIALMIKEMDTIRKEEESAFVASLNDLTLEEYKDLSSNVNLTCFDDEVSRFLKKQMNEAEEVSFKAKLKANKLLESRAKTIALTIKEMQSIKKKEEVRVVEQIAEVGESQFRKEVGLPSKVIPLVPFMKRHVVAASLFRKEVGLPSKVISLVPFMKRHVAAACIAGLIVLSVGSVGIMQLNAYNKTIVISEKYYAYVPNGLSNFRSDIDKDTITLLRNMFANVESGTDLENTIVVLSQAYEKSLDETNELNYLRNDIAWNLSMAYLKMGNRKASKPILEDLVNNTDPGRPLHDYAQKALNDINEIISLW